MRTSLLALLFMLLSLHLFAQPDNWYFSLSMGGCLPIKTYGTTDPDVTNAGFALNGFALNLDATYPLSNHWGLKGMVLLNTNPVDREGMGTMMENRMKEQVPFTEADREYLTLTVNSWMTNSIVVGPLFTINFDRVAWDFQAMAGMNVTYLPNQQLVLNNPANNWQYLQRNSNTVNVSMSYLAGTALRIKVSEKVQLKLAVDYQMSQSNNKYEELKLTKNNNNIITEELNTGSIIVPKDVVMWTIGFVYYL